MNKTTSDLLRIAAAGGGFSIDAEAKTTSDIVRIVAAASNGGGSITVKNTDSKTTSDLVRIASAGKGLVFFDS